MSAQIAELYKMVKDVRNDIVSVRQEIQSIREVMLDSSDWRLQINAIFRRISENNKNFVSIRTISYKLLEQRAKCDLSIRINNKLVRAKRQGYSSIQIDNLNYLDVIEEDPHLKEIYLTIVKQLAIKYNAI